MARAKKQSDRPGEILKNARADLNRLFHRVEQEGRRSIEALAAKGKLSRPEAEQALDRFLERLEEKMAKAESDLARRLELLAEKAPPSVEKQDVERLSQMIREIETSLDRLPKAPFARGKEDRSA